MLKTNIIYRDEISGKKNKIIGGFGKFGWLLELR
jgi:hypothetical protein